MRFDLSGAVPQYKARARFVHWIASGAVLLGVVGWIVIFLMFRATDSWTPLTVAALIGIAFVTILFAIIGRLSAAGPMVFEVDGSGVRAVFANGRARGVTWGDPHVRLQLATNSGPSDRSSRGPVFSVSLGGTRNIFVTEAAYRAVLEEAGRQGLATAPVTYRSAGWTGVILARRQ